MPARATVIALLVVMTATPSFGGMMRCNNRVVSAGETKAEVVMKCGEPSSRDSHQEEMAERTEGGLRITTVTVDDWTYDFGPDSLIRFLTFRNNSLVVIREGGYGNAGAARRPGCDEPFPDPGASRLEVSAKCGEPTFKDVRQEDIVEAQDSGIAKKITVNVEEWTYNLGPDRLIRVFVFNNGKLLTVRTGGYGN